MCFLFRGKGEGASLIPANLDPTAQDSLLSLFDPVFSEHDNEILELLSELQKY